MTGEKLRLFIAINLPKAKREQMEKLIERLKAKTDGVRWEDKNKIHLTLAFLGYVPSSKIGLIEKTIADAICGFNPFSLSFDRLGFFLRSGRLVIWLGISKSHKLTKLKLSLDQHLKKQGLRTEKRPFSPHMTLGRKKKASHGKRWQSITEKWNQKFSPQSFMVEEIVLLKSTLTPKGSKYSVVGQYLLK